MIDGSRNSNVYLFVRFVLISKKRYDGFNAFNQKQNNQLVRNFTRDQEVQRFYSIRTGTNMSSPVQQAKRRALKLQVSDDEAEAEYDLNDVSMVDEDQDDGDDKENELPPSPSSPSPCPVNPRKHHSSVQGTPKSRRPSLAPIDQNTTNGIGNDKIKLLNNVKLDPPSQSQSQLPPPQSPKHKTAFNGPDIIQLSPIKSSKTAALNHYSQDQPKEPIIRLVINKLVLNNFKSYAGTQIIGPFHSSFSAVVGPNGSGKSNVIDSLLFVFGFRANKMRQGKLSELIHNSEAAPNLQSCSVDVHFNHVTDNLDDTTTIVPGSELIVSRIAYKNNGSDYTINGKKSNYKEVTTLLRNKGIDLDHKRFLILQGEVESIAQMKAKAEKENDDGLLEYLEDIIGTSDYKATIEDSFKKIEELNEVCQEKENRFGLVEKEKSSLESKKDEALDFLFKEKTLVEQKSLLFQFKMHKCQETINTNNLVLKELQEKLSTEKTESTGFEKEVKTLEKEYTKLTSSIEDISNNIKNLQDIQKKSDREKITVEEKKKSLESKKKKSFKLLETAIHALNEAESKLETITNENVTFEQELTKLKDSLIQEKASLDEIRSELTDKTKGFNEEIEVYEKQLQPWNEQLDAKRSQIQVAESQVNLLKETKNKTFGEIENLKKRIQTITDDGNENEKKLITLKREIIHITKQIELGEQECSHASGKLNEMNGVLSNHRQRTLEARGSLSNIENKSKVLAGLMRLQESGRIQGFYGRLGDLGYIDDQYDVAISTACGQLDDMVVETVEVGQQCIEYLRKNNLGYARFILLTKLRKFNLSAINTPGNVPRLFDLVKPQDPKFAPAFYSVLQDTLVASNLREANSVAYGARRYRVVTLDGKLIDKSGTLSGGGNHVSRGGMKSTSSANSVSEKDVIKLEQELAEKEKNFEIAQNTYYEMTDALKEMKERKPEIENQMSKLKFENESLSNELKNSQNQLQEAIKANDAMKSNDKEISNAEKQVQSLQKEYENLTEQTKEIHNKINELQEKIMQVGGVKLRLQKSKVDGLNETIELTNEKINNNKVSLKKLQNELKRFSKSKIDKENEIQSFTNELEKIESNYQEKIKSFENLETELNELLDSKDDFNSKAEILKEKLDENLEKINKYRSTAIELENKVERHSGIIKQETRHLNEYLEGIRSLEARDVTELVSFITDDEERAKFATPVLSELSPDEIKALDIEKIEIKTEELETYISNAKINVDVLEEYGKRAVEYNSRKNDLNQAVNERDEIKKMSEDLKKKRLDEFMEGFNIISATLKEMYQMITMGGNAELELVDSLDPFSEGILFSVMPPKKSWKNISNLSGGEKTLSSLALVFALHRYKPTPLYVMDEIDAALDFRNVSIVANYIKERTKNAQFVVISLRNNMFELAQQLVGIYKVNNMTRSITLQNRDLLDRD
ncbi:Structural maintenance of chromosomes protein [Wickerhamomyces ciferrii]|uniref:Structural maintenance of chromosomes protein n=1 Tax=Wickerhamomyces ciferrii (strain ATCC 14091 / BCRC 22168 / CBS 111 / JCM 3599 / NBRC 0793 / NRRL Y-1031 F-60-10) TaxID=1206466 RepID=K0KLS7_WICCF|nr:Structural maintenance of chromosomes protein [Wickerhamomyces ciferrii]CCH46220.1 Structural maintenance of chromosomes protein [Wickerhamomyces ciferrii]